MKTPVHLGERLNKESEASPNVPSAFAAKLSRNGAETPLTEPQLSELTLLTRRGPGQDPQCPASIEKEHLS